MTPASNHLALRDIHLPAGIAWWPPAPGWWLVAAAIAVLLLIAIVMYRYRQKRKVLRAAQQELNKIKQAYAQAHDERQLVQQLSTYLRRVCLTVYAREEVAGLTGKYWLAFLDQGLANSKTTPRFSGATGQVLLSGPYQRSGNIDAEALLALCDDWTAALPKHQRGRK